MSWQKHFIASEDAGVPRVLNYNVFTRYGARFCLKLFPDDSEEWPRFYASPIATIVSTSFSTFLRLLETILQIIR